MFLDTKIQSFQPFIYFWRALWGFACGGVKRRGAGLMLPLGGAGRNAHAQLWERSNRLGRNMGTNEEIN